MVQNAASGFILNKYPNINDAMNIKWLPIEEQIEYSLIIMRFKAIYNENAPKKLKLKQRVSSVRNLQSNNDKEIIINNQQSKTFEKQTEDIFNKLTKIIRSVDTLSAFKTKVKNHLPDQT